MKNLFFLIAIIFFASSCSSLKPASSGSTTSNNQKQSSSLQFIDNVSIKPNGNKSPEVVTNKRNNVEYKRPVKTLYGSGLENYSALQFKYAILENATVEEMQNERLLEFMEEWYGTKYHYGGAAKDGIDCSAFVSTLMSVVYGISDLPRMSKDQFIATSRVSKNNLREGDLVFFHTYGKKKKAVTHVGVYLRNNKFIHASISGVMISDMSDGYYSAHYVGAGRSADLSGKDAAAN